MIFTLASFRLKASLAIFSGVLSNWKKLNSIFNSKVDKHCNNWILPLLLSALKFQQQFLQESLLLFALKHRQQFCQVSFLTGKKLSCISIQKLIKILCVVVKSREIAYTNLFFPKGPSILLFIIISCYFWRCLFHFSSSSTMIIDCLVKVGLLFILYLFL